MKPKARTLDPWLRLHLYAQRLEELYARFEEVFDLEADDFPAETLEAAAPRGPMGRGPHLGAAGKFRVLLLEKASGLARYSGTWLGGPVDIACRHYYPELDAFFFGISYEFLTGAYRNDGALFCAVAHGVVQNLASAFRGAHENPLWWSLGLARWFAREIDPRYQIYTGGKDDDARGEDESDWEPKVRARVGHGVFPSTEDMLDWSDPAALSFADHMILWSRVDYVLRRPKTAHALPRRPRGAPARRRAGRPPRRAPRVPLPRRLRGGPGAGPGRVRRGLVQVGGEDVRQVTASRRPARLTRSAGWRG